MSDAFNYFYTGEGLTNVSQSIALKLIENQTLLKLLYYQGTDALSQPDVPDDIKYSMIDQTDLENTKIFFSPFPPIAENNQIVQVRFYEYSVRPENNVLADFTFAFEIIVNHELWTLNGGLVRPREIYREILKTLNGAGDFGGIGVFNFLSNWRYATFSQYHNGYVLFGSTKLT